MFCTQCGTQYEGNACPACSSNAQVTPPEVSTTPAYTTGTDQTNGGSTTLQLSGWWRRVGASIIDSIVLLPVSLIAGVIFPSHLSGPTIPSLNSGVAIGAEVLQLVFQFGYLSLMWSRQNGQTVGNKALSSRVVRADGTPITPDVAYRRAAILILIDVAGTMVWPLRPIGMILVILNVLWPLWDSKNQTLHDKAAGTVVVKL